MYVALICQYHTAGIISKVQCQPANLLSSNNLEFPSLAGICCIMYNVSYVVVYVAHVMEFDHEIEYSKLIL